MYRVWLDNLLLPIAPAKIDTKIKGNNKSINLINDGEVSLLKTAGLTEFSFEVLIPQVKYPFADYGNEEFISATVYLEKLERLLVDKEPFYFKVDRAMPNGVLLFGTEKLVSLEDYSIKEDAKDGFDLVASIKLKQFKEFSTTTAKVVTDEEGNTSLEEEKSRETAKSGEPKGSPKSYTVVKGDCLWNIAKRYYNDGSKYPVIAKANSIANPNLIYPGQVLTIPVL